VTAATEGAGMPAEPEDCDMDCRCSIPAASGTSADAGSGELRGAAADDGMATLPNEVAGRAAAESYVMFSYRSPNSNYLLRLQVLQLHGEESVSARRCLQGL
jgi:hypothetical protein